jgi:hypothetical protein
VRSILVSAVWSSEAGGEESRSWSRERGREKSSGWWRDSGAGVSRFGPQMENLEVREEVGGARIDPAKDVDQGQIADAGVVDQEG